MLRQKYDLPDVLSVVRECAVERLHDRVRFLPDGYGARHVFWFECVESRENLRPTLFPAAHDFFARRASRNFEFLISEPIWFLAIGGQEFREARTRVAGNVLDEDRDRVCFWIDR